MNTTLLEKFLSRKGQIATIEFSRKLKTRKEFSHLQIEKHVTMGVRCGIQYDNINNVQEKRESGELPAVNQGLPWGSWVKGLENYVIEHKGAEYLRFATLNNGKNERSFTLDGQPVTREQIESFCLASEFAEKPELDVFCVKMESIKDIR